MADYLPRRDAGLLQWAGNFHKHVAADPGTYGLTSEMVAALGEAYNTFAAALAVATAPQTRTVSNIIEKDAARRALETTIRELVRTVRGTPGISNEQIAALGLRPRTAKRRKVAAPTTSPRVTLFPIEGVMLRVELRGQDTTRRGKPVDVAGATIYTHVGPTPPTDPTAWRMACNTTTPRCQVPFPVELPPGTKVWVTACWLSPTAEPGPLCQPVYAYLTAGLRFDKAA